MCFFRLIKTFPSVPGCKWFLYGLDRLIARAGMSFKISQVSYPSKGKSGLHITLDEYQMAMNKENKTVKNLGKVSDSSLKDTARFSANQDQLDTKIRPSKKTQALDVPTQTLAKASLAPLNSGSTSDHSGE